MPARDHGAPGGDGVCSPGFMARSASDTVATQGNPKNEIKGGSDGESNPDRLEDSGRSSFFPPRPSLPFRGCGGRSPKLLWVEAGGILPAARPHEGFQRGVQRGNLLWPPLPTIFRVGTGSRVFQGQRTHSLFGFLPESGRYHVHDQGDLVRWGTGTLCRTRGRSLFREDQCLVQPAGSRWGRFRHEHLLRIPCPLWGKYQHQPGPVLGG